MPKWFVDTYSPASLVDLPTNTWGPYADTYDVNHHVSRILDNNEAGIDRIVIRIAPEAKIEKFELRIGGRSWGD